MDSFVSSNEFYKEYHGHKSYHLKNLLEVLKLNGKNSFIYLAGDSSLDNKYWILNDPAQTAINGYEHFLRP
jgi:hypothetical protein